MHPVAQSLTALKLRLLRHVRPFGPARPRWRRVLSDRPSPFAGAGTEMRVLVATSTGSNWQMSGFESVLAAALGLRGAQIDVLLCDGVLPACQECDIRLLPEHTLLKQGAKPLCPTCFPPARRMFAELGVTPLRYGDYLDAATLDEIAAFIATRADAELASTLWQGIAVGEHARSGALRYYALGEIDAEPRGFEVLRRYLDAAMRSVSVMENLLSEQRYDVVVFHHGIYVPQGPLGDVCRKHGVRVVNWNLAYREGTMLFSHEDSYHRTMTDPGKADWEHSAFGAAEERELMDYLQSRRTGGNDWISFQRQDEAFGSVAEKLGLDAKLPIIGLLTNVMWDAQLHFDANAFSSMLDWLDFTIAHFAERPDLQLVIRAHPAELLGSVPSRQRVAVEIARRWPELPPNIRVIGPDDPINTYAVMRGCDSVLVYGTKMALELPCWGVPVIVAGEAWARGKGFTTDVSSPEGI